MAIEIKYAVNMALQYNNANEFNIEDYLLADNETGKLFLTESPTKRVLNEAEKSALYFLIDDSLFNASAFYEMYDSGNVKIDEKILEMGYDHLIHNAIPVNLNAFYVDPDVKRIDVSVISNQDLVLNGNFAQGTGNTFTSWTKNEAGGSIVQSATGGVGGSRAAVLTKGVGSTFLSEPNVVAPSTQYTLSFWAKSLSGTPSLIFGNTGVWSTQVINSTELTRYEFNFTSNVAETTLDIEISGGAGVSALIDDVAIRSITLNRLTEIKSYDIDRECYDYSFQINWLNKLGGRDTFMFGAKPNIETVVERNNLIELSKLSNFESPKRIYGYREHISRKIYNLVHFCKDRATAEWLKRELIDSIDIMMVINDYYYPVLVLNSSIEENKFSNDYIVSLQFRLAFDNNIQTR